MENGTRGDRDPQNFLRKVSGQPVLVRLNSGIDYKGEFTSGVFGANR